jgi:hypothetical protein
MASSTQILAGSSLKSICTGIDNIASRCGAEARASHRSRTSSFWCALGKKAEAGRTGRRLSRREAAGHLKALDPGQTGESAENGMPKVSWQTHYK